MDCLRYNSKYKDGISDQYKEEQKRKKLFYHSRRVSFDNDDEASLTDEEHHKRECYVRESDYLLRQSLDYWGD